MTTRALKLNTGKSLKVLSSLEEQFALQVRAAKLPEPRREYRFCDRKFRFDFAFVPQAVAVELHGGTYSQGRHTRGSGFALDREKVNLAQLMGWVVIEATSEHVRDGRALQWLETALANT